MRKCVMIKVLGNVQADSYKNFVQKSATGLNVEGSVQNDADAGGIIIYVCSQSGNLDKFIDILYKGIDRHKPTEINVEPFVSEKDFRGVFRIIG